MTNPGRPKHLLFVCVENCNRSQMAEAFARMLGLGQVEVYSAGIRPAGAVHPKALEAMRELGYDLTGHMPKGFSSLQNVEFDVAVTMGCKDQSLPIQTKVREDWNVPCPKALSPEQFRVVRDLIGEKTKVLLERLYSDLDC
jgi:protein-tyrosine-phosphatase